MRFSTAFVTLASAVIVIAGDTTIVTMSSAQWKTIAPDGSITTFTPKVYAGVTVYGSPTVTATASISKWVSLDISGNPYDMTATTTTSGTVTSTTNPSPTPELSDKLFYQEQSPVLGCWESRLPPPTIDGLPFCTPQNGTELVVGETYFVTWNPTWFGGGIDDVLHVTLQGRSVPIDDDNDEIFRTDSIINAFGFYPLTVEYNYTTFSEGGYFYLNIIPVIQDGTNATHTGTKSGPLMRFINTRQDGITEITRVPSDNVKSASLINDGDSSSGGGLSRTIKIVIAVIIPVAVIFV
ncbi:hypothetical protein V1519DRAFT_211824 [Lipomyces tetrasporus]